MFREVVRNAGLEIFAEVGIVIFILCFLLAVFQTVWMRRSAQEHAANLPLHDGSTLSNEPGGDHGHN